MNDAKILIDALLEPLGDYAPRPHTFIVDYVDLHGVDRWEKLIAYIPRELNAEAALSEIMRHVAEVGGTVSCVYEPMNGYTHEQLEALLETDPDKAKQNIRYHYLNLDAVAHERS